MVRLRKIPGVRYVPQLEYRPAKSALWALAVAVVGGVSLTASFGAPRDNTPQPAPTPPSPVRAAGADLTGDGQVTTADLSFLLHEWGKSASKADLDGDGVVGAGDMSVLMSQWRANR